MADKKKKANSTYQKYKKRPFKYDQTPLHRAGEGIAVNRRNVQTFNARLNITPSG